MAAIDRFEVLDLIGEGGMALVLLARDPRRSDPARRVAVKLLRPEFVAQPRAVHRFLVEARHVQRLAHPHILPVLEVSDRPEGPYFVTPYLPGGSLAGRIKPGLPLDEPTVLRIVLQLADALGFAHDKGLIHRDLKPGNVLLDGDDTAYLADFGLCRSTLANDSLVDVRRTPIEGTAPYLAPEVAAGKAGDFRCDVYAFGALLFEMLTGDLPYDGPTPAEVIEQVIAGPPPPILVRNPRASPGLAAVADGCLARELRDRYATMADVAADLQRIENGRPPLGPHGRAKHPGSRRTARTTGLLVFGLAIIAVGAWRFRPAGAKPRLSLSRPSVPPASPIPSPTPSADASTAIELPFVVELDGPGLDQTRWQANKTNSFSQPYQGKVLGEQSGDWRLESGTLVLEANADCLRDDPVWERRGLSALEDVWVDCPVDLKTQEDVVIEAELSADGVGGHIFVALAGPEPPKSIADLHGVPLFRAGQSSGRSCTLNKQQVRIELSQSSGLATVCFGGLPGATSESGDIDRACSSPPCDGQPGVQLQLVDISTLPVWRLRFLAEASTSSGFAPGQVRFTLYRVKLARNEDRLTSIAGWVTDETTKRPVPDAQVQWAGGECRRANGQGMYVLPLGTIQDDYGVRAEAVGYNSTAEKHVVRKSGRQLRRDLTVQKSDQKQVGDPISCYPVRCANVSTFVVTNDQLVFSATKAESPSHLYRWPDRNGEPEPVFEVQGLSGLARCRGVLYGVSMWKEKKKGDQQTAVGMLCRVNEQNGRCDQELELGTPWPRSLACDCDDTHARFWFVESDPISGRTGIHALDLASGEEKTFAQSDDEHLEGIAFVPGADGHHRLLVSSVVDENAMGYAGSLDAPRGVVYVVDPDKLFEKKRLDPTDKEVVVAQFPGYWHQLSYDAGARTLWGMDRGKDQMCRICIEQSCQTETSNSPEADSSQPPPPTDSRPEASPSWPGHPAPD